MGVRGFIRDIIFIYFGFQLLINGLRGIPISKGQSLLLAVFLLFFSVWFMLERVGIIPKLD